MLVSTERNQFPNLCIGHELLFLTEPLPPPQPKLMMAVKDGKKKNSSFTAELYPTDDQNGPIG